MSANSNAWIALVAVLCMARTVRRIDISCVLSSGITVEERRQLYDTFGGCARLTSISLRDCQDWLEVERFLSHLSPPVRLRHLSFNAQFPAVEVRELAFATPAVFGKLESLGSWRLEVNRRCEQTLLAAATELEELKLGVSAGWSADEYTGGLASV